MFFLGGGRGGISLKRPTDIVIIEGIMGASLFVETALLPFIQNTFPPPQSHR